ncbi:MAG: glutathione S-transferase N-terminal domain-containing protein [Gammaproteobacteria bacterium]|nr:glutathione S-transferase N-terminal domain-containing protein [Gammaproteobacteria bacterium]
MHKLHNLKFYMTPGSCSTGIHILLEELELVFEAYIVNLPAGEHYTREYVAINPKSTIPTLVKPDGEAITEYGAICYWLARSYPKAKLLPDEIDAATRVLEILNYAVNSVHLQGYTRIFTPEQYAFESHEIERVKAQGETIVKKAFVLLNRQIAGNRYVAGDRFSIADPALFYLEFWADRIGLKLPEHCQVHYRNMLERPAVKQVLMEEGYGALYR